MQIMFFIASGVAVFATIMVITRLNAVHALLYLIVSLLSIAVIFFIMGAPFAAALEVIIYAGAIMVLFVFVIMMLNLGREAVEHERNMMSLRVWLPPLFLVLILMGQFIYILCVRYGAPITATEIPPKQVGISLFSTYLLGVELSGLLLIAGIIGAYHLGQTRGRPRHRFLKGGSE
jgi:NADH-quinone oxidoreductase subunit J